MFHIVLCLLVLEIYDSILFYGVMYIYVKSDNGNYHTKLGAVPLIEALSFFAQKQGHRYFIWSGNLISHYALLYTFTCPSPHPAKYR
jgi:hypothetical protein